MSERKRGVAVHLVDMGPLEQEATDWVKAKRLDLIDKGLNRLKVGFSPWGIFEDADGVTILVCNEGVGYHVLEEEPPHIGLYAEYNQDPEVKTISMFPLFGAPVTREYVWGNLTGERADLADHIRSFGARLEENFRDLYRLAMDGDHARQIREAG